MGSLGLSRFSRDSHAPRPRTHCPICGSGIGLTGEQEQHLKSSQSGLALRCAVCRANWAVRTRTRKGPRHLDPAATLNLNEAMSVGECEVTIKVHPHRWPTASQLEQVESLNRLSNREREVLSHLVQGRLNKQISIELDISVKTVEKHRSNIKRKLNVRTTVDMLRIALLAELECVGRLPFERHVDVAEPVSDERAFPEPALRSWTGHDSLTSHESRSPRISGHAATEGLATDSSPST